MQKMAFHDLKNDKTTVIFHGAEPYRILAVKHRILIVIFGLYS